MLDDCFLHDEDRLSRAEALETLRKRTNPVVGVTQVPVNDIAGRILAEQVIAPRKIPAHTTAAVNGYAFAFSDYNPSRGMTLPVTTRAPAGEASSEPLAKGTAARIFNGWHQLGLHRLS